MPDPRDKLELRNRVIEPSTLNSDASGAAAAARARFLSIWFRCCHTYGRLYRNAAETKYEGRCPRCGAAVHAAIGPGGTKRRIFEAR